MQYVYVVGNNGKPLMPCSPAKARKLLKTKSAAVLQRTPFTIKLLHHAGGYKQPITLGVDAGSKHIGLSACTETKELYKEELTPRNDVVKLLSQRRECRRGRRYRKTRYRAPRFNNRVHSKHKGWLAPSVEVKIQEHITAIHRICRRLPVTSFITGRRSSGYFALKKLDGTTISNSAKYKEIQFLEPANHYIIERS